LPQGKGSFSVWEQLEKIAKDSICWSEEKLDKEFFIKEGIKDFILMKKNYEYFYFTKNYW
jgi:hypothetical protein